MNKANRAAQFQPFDALKGLQEELRMREERRNRVEKKEVSEEKAEEISRELIKIQKGSNVEIVFYRNGSYYELTGCVFAKNDKPFEMFFFAKTRFKMTRKLLSF